MTWSKLDNTSEGILPVDLWDRNTVTDRMDLTVSFNKEDLMTNSDTQPLIVERQDRLLIITFNRPDTLNAFNTVLTQTMHDLLVEVTGDQSIGAILFKGNGRAFSAGADLKESPEDHEKTEDLLQRVLELLRPIDKVLIAAVQGHCYVGAFKLIACCDLIVATETTKIKAQVRGPREGSDWSKFIMARFGQSAMRRLEFTADVIDGADAYRLGICQWLVGEEQLQEFALELAQKTSALEARQTGFLKGGMNAWPQ